MHQHRLPDLGAGADAGRPPRFDAGSDDVGAGVVADLHLQLLVDHLHHGHLAPHPQERIGSGAHDCRTVISPDSPSRDTFTSLVSFIHFL